MNTTELILEHIAESLSAPVSVFSESGELLNYYGDMKESNALLKSSAFKEALLRLANEDYPVIYEEFYPVYSMIIKNKNIIYIIGSVNCDYTIEQIEGIPLGRYYVKKHNIEAENYRLSFVEMKQFCYETLLLFNFLTNRKMTYKELYRCNTDLPQIEKAVKKELNQVYFNFQEHEKLHHSYIREKQELECIRRGDLEGIHELSTEIYEGDFGTLSKNPLQAMKNIAISGITLFTRAAIEGGLYPEEAFSISDSYILQIDTAATIYQTEALMTEAEYEFAKCVRDLKLTKSSNDLIEDAKSLIYKSLHSRIVNKEIAGKLHVSPEYLSSLFKKVEGVTMNEYIISKKIQQAENLLIYSEYTIEEIGFYLGFCSQSHFGKTFKRINHLTPNEYRERNKKKEFRTQE